MRKVTNRWISAGRRPSARPQPPAEIRRVPRGQDHEDPARAAASTTDRLLRAERLGHRATSLARSPAEASAGPLGPFQTDSSPAVRRDVGFEFQTSMTSTGFYDRTTGNKVNEGKVEYYQGPGYSIEGDEGDLELVTEPFPETASGYGNLRRTIIGMEIFADLIAGRVVPLTHFRNYLWLTPEEKNLEGKSDVVLKAEPKILTDPQTTVGVKLDQLFNLASNLAEAEKRGSAYLSSATKTLDEEAKFKKTEKGTEKTVSPSLMEYGAQELADFIGWKSFQATEFQEKIVKSSVEDVAKIEGISSSLKGFLFLVLQYIRGAAEYPGEKTPAAAKFATPIMSRTNLANVFEKLSEEDRNFFAENYKEISSKVFNVDITKDLFPPGMYFEYYKKSFSIETWLDDIIEKGIDQSSAYESLGDISNVPPQGLVYNEATFEKFKEFHEKKSEAHGRYMKRLESSTDIGPDIGGEDRRTDGVILELRKLGAKLTQQEWLAFASAVFELVVLLNQGAEARNEIMGVNAFKKKYGL